MEGKGVCVKVTFLRELTDEQRQRMDAKFWKGYDTVIEAMKEARDERADSYNFISSVVDYYPEGPEESLWIVRTKMLRLQNDLARLRATPPALTATKEKIRADILESVRDGANYVAYTYASILAEEVK